ncbi:MAG TPA: RIP metalloprotease RseP [Thermoanaerobaculia bacterium]|jgi:regulator of sigma E protease
MAQTFATNILGFVIVLGFLIFVHEAGHFFVAKFFKVRVLVFSFGFGKRLLGFRRGDTDYRLSLIPLGGYVRMAGDTPEDNQPGNPDEFLSKPKWQRFLILVAGPFMNIVIAITFLAALAMIGIPQAASVKPVIGEVLPLGAAAKAGLQVGDRIVRIGNETIDEFDDLRMAISMNAGTALPVIYERNGQRRTTTLTPARESSEYGPVGRAGISPWIDPMLGATLKGSAAEKAGLKEGDRITGINGKPVQQVVDVSNVLDKSKGKPVQLDVLRGGQTLKITLADDQTESRGILLPSRIEKRSLVPALRYSLSENWRMLRYAGAAIGRMFRPEGSVRELSGPVAIAKISGQVLRSGWQPLVALMAMISLQLGVMNLLPIPVLDGGHIMILLLEGIARRDFSIRVKERIQQVGFAALATLMLVVLYNDVITHVLGIGKG